MWYALSQYNIKSRNSIVLYLSSDITTVRDFCKQYINNILNIRNENIDNDFMKTKVSYADNNKKLVIYKNVKKLNKGYIYNTTEEHKVDLYYYNITFISPRSTRLIRISSKANFTDYEIKNFKIDVTEDKNIHKQLMNELSERFKEKGLDNI